MSWTIGVDSIDHRIRQQLYQDGGISAPSPAVEGGTKWTFWHFEAFIGQVAGRRTTHSLAQERVGLKKRTFDDCLTPESGRNWVTEFMSAYDPERTLDPCNTTRIASLGQACLAVSFKPMVAISFVFAEFTLDEELRCNIWDDLKYFLPVGPCLVGLSQLSVTRA